MKITEFVENIKNNFPTATITIKNQNQVFIETQSDEIRRLIEICLKNRLIFVAEFCSQTKQFLISNILADRNHGYLVLIRYNTESEVVSLQDLIYQTHLFEREIADLYGLKIKGGRDKRHLQKHEAWQKDIFPMRKDFPYGQHLTIANEIEDYEFKKPVGDGVYQIPVGPVHAGIIEPGHFRFTVMGEPIENLELRMMYKYRGIEKIAENLDANLLNLLFERMAGESTVAYSELYAKVIENMLKIAIPKPIQAVRTILLELERIYNFFDDIAGICVDVAFSYPAKKFNYFSELIRQLAERITGSRYMRNCIVPGGINFSFIHSSIQDIQNTIAKIKPRFENMVKMTNNATSFLDRVEKTGIVSTEIAEKYLMTGVVGRASMIPYDVRLSFPYELYGDIKKIPNIQMIGGVYERYNIKIQEIRDGFEFIEKALKEITSEIPQKTMPIKISEGTEGMAIVETVKGELLVYLIAGKNNCFDRVYFKVPSFTSWDGLTQAVLGEIVPDFPLCNKSFNMSYSENDK